MISENELIRRHRPYTREMPKPGGPVPLRELLDAVSDALRTAGEPLPGEYVPSPRVARDRARRARDAEVK